MAHVWKVEGITDTCGRCGEVRTWDKERTQVISYKPGTNNDCSQQYTHTKKQIKEYHTLRVNGQKIRTAYSEVEIKELLDIGIKNFCSKYKLYKWAKTAVTKIYNRLSAPGKRGIKSSGRHDDPTVNSDLLQTILKTLPQAGTPMKKEVKEAYMKIVSGVLDIMHPEA